MYDPHLDTDLGISTSGWTRYQVHQTGLDVNVAWTRFSIQGHSGVPKIDPTFST